MLVHDLDVAQALDVMLLEESKNFRLIDASFDVSNPQLCWVA